jgi:hypothetical protein
MLVGNTSMTCQNRSVESVFLPSGFSEYLAAEPLAPGLCPEVQSNQELLNWKDSNAVL